MLSTKPRKDAVSNKKFRNAHNLLVFTTSGYYLLYHLLMLKYLNITSTSLTTIDILKFSISKSDFYSYAKVIQNVQAINEHVRSNKTNILSI